MNPLPATALYVMEDANFTAFKWYVYKMYTYRGYNVPEGILYTANCCFNITKQAKNRLIPPTFVTKRCVLLVGTTWY